MVNHDTTPINVFTDGACLGNPGPGGYAALLVYQGEELVFTGGEHHTTNNRMELLAAIRALENFPLIEKQSSTRTANISSKA